MKFEKSFFNFEKNDEHKNFDNDKSNANNEFVDANASANANANASENANANNFSDDINENENQTDFAKNFQKKKRDDENCSRRTDEI